jgi:type 1 glutamine amidotransferase
MRLTIVGFLALLSAACSYEPPSVEPPVDAPAPAPDARPLGMIDGECVGEPGRPRVLVYTYENLWRHLSNYHARAAIYDMCTTRGFSVTTTNDPRAINATRLAAHDVIVFAVTSGSGLDAASRADLEAWLRAGGGYVGLEAAAATETQWPFYVENVGAAFAGHPPGLQLGTVRVEPAAHPITEGLPASFDLVEQWYIFDRRPEEVPGIEVLLTLDETTLPADFPPEYQVGYHAIGWAHERFGGRAFYTGLGDNPDGFADPTLLELIGRAIEWTGRGRGWSQ